MGGSTGGSIRVALEQYSWTPAFEISYETKRAEMALSATEFPSAQAIVAGFEGRFRNALPDAYCFTVKSPILGRGLSEGGWVLSKAFGRKTFGAAHIVFLATRQTGDSLLLRLYAVSSPLNTSALRGTLVAITSLFAILQIFSVVLSWFTGQGLSEALSSGKLAQMSGDFSGLLLIGAAVVFGLGFGIPLCDLAGKAVFGIAEFLFERQLRRLRAWAEPLAVAQRVLDETIHSGDLHEEVEAPAPHWAHSGADPDVPKGQVRSEPSVGVPTEIEGVAPIRLGGATDLLNLTYLQTLGRFWLALLLSLGTPLFIFTFGKLLLTSRGPLNSIVPKVLIYCNAGLVYGIAWLTCFVINASSHGLLILLGVTFGLEEVPEIVLSVFVIQWIALSSQFAVRAGRAVLFRTAVGTGKLMTIERKHRKRSFRWWFVVAYAATLCLFALWHHTRSINGFSRSMIHQGVSAVPANSRRQITNLGDVKPGISIGSNGKILFNRENLHGIFKIDLDGSNLVQLTSHRGDMDPSWGPNGEILFSSDRDGAQEIYAMSSSGQDIRKLTDLQSWAVGPAWDGGGRIAFSAFDPERNKMQLYIMDVLGGAVRTVASMAGDATNPSWSPNRRRLAFNYRVDEESDSVWAIDYEGRNMARVSDGLLPQWGTRGIAYNKLQEGRWKVAVYDLQWREEIFFEWGKSPFWFGYDELGLVAPSGAGQDIFMIRLHQLEGSRG